MDIKYTKEGKKVAVLGKLNNEQWIVQEIFVSGNQELPMGENFVERTLLDEPAETWQSRDLRKQEERKKRTEKEIKDLDDKCRIFNDKARAYSLTNRILESYGEVGMGEIKQLIDFLSGKITHLVVENYQGWKITSLVDATASFDSWGWNRRFEGLKLISLFGSREDGIRYGEKERKYSLDYRINDYSDGSGCFWKKVYPCSSMEEAKDMVDAFLANKELVTADDIKTKEEYNLVNPSTEKIAKFYIGQADSMRINIETAKNKIKIDEDKLKEFIKQIPNAQRR